MGQRREPDRRPRAADDKGIALLVALALVAILAVVIFDYSFSVRVDMHIAANFRDRLVALEAAKGGVNYAIYVLRQDTSPGDNLQDEWAQLGGEGSPGIALNKTDPYEMLEQEGLTEEEVRLQDHEEFASRQKGGNVPIARIFVCDEERKINVNLLAGSGAKPMCREWIQNLIENLEFPEVDAYRLVDNITDWIDSDDDGEAEYLYYERLGYSCRNDKMQSIYELKLVDGVTDLLFFGDTPYPTQLSGLEEEQWDEWERLGYTLPEAAPWEREKDPDAIYGLVNFLTAHSVGMVNFNTAPREVLKALLENDDLLADTIIEARQEAPLGGRELPNLIGGDLYNILSRNGAITSQSYYFRIESTGQFHRTAVKVIAIVSRDNNRDITIRYWREEDARPERASEEVASYDAVW